MDYINKSAELSTDGVYRYRLIRDWDPSKPQLLFIMLNPSTADGLGDDATIRKCVGFAKQLGYGSISVVNLFAFRATDPKELTKAADPVGNPQNDLNIAYAAKQSGMIIAAWGNMGEFMDRSLAVRHLLKEYPIYCLGTTKAGEPKHPLYLLYGTAPVMYKAAGSANLLTQGRLMPAT